jgi:hypothetical protein
VKEGEKEADSSAEPLEVAAPTEKKE